MTSKGFIKNKMRALVEKFPDIKITYQFDKFLKTHIVEVLPKELFEISEEYKLLESEIIFEFDDIFLSESILFISEDSLNEIDNPEFELCGPEYVLFESKISFDSEDYITAYNISDKLFSNMETLGIKIPVTSFNSKSPIIASDNVIDEEDFVAEDYSSEQTYYLALAA